MAFVETSFLFNFKSAGGFFYIQGPFGKFLNSIFYVFHIDFFIINFSKLCLQ